MPPPIAPTIYLAHGASGSAASMQPHVDGLRERGLEARAVQLPVGLAEKAIGRYRDQVTDLPHSIIGGQSYGGRVASLLAADEPPRGLETRAVELPVGLAEKAIGRYRDQVTDLAHSIIGGQSYGGRVASLLAADEPPRGLVLLCFPLHRPGQPDASTRVGHFARIDCPVLLLSGEADPFARLDLLRAAVKQLRHARLVTYPRLGHSLRPVLDDALDRVAEFARALG